MINLFHFVVTFLLIDLIHTSNSIISQQSEQDVVYFNSYLNHQQNQQQYTIKLKSPTIPVEDQTTPNKDYIHIYYQMYKNQVHEINNPCQIKNLQSEPQQIGYQKLSNSIDSRVYFTEQQIGMYKKKSSEYKIEETYVINDKDKQQRINQGSKQQNIDEHLEDWKFIQL